MLRTINIKQTGMSLVELMIGLLVGMIVLGGVISIYIATISSSTDTLKAAKLNQQLSSAIAVMVSDIRRAGYWGAAAPNNLNNPFTTSTTNMDIHDSSTCIVYTHDLNSLGTVDDGSGGTGDEYFGFKLDTSGTGKIQMKNGAANAANAKTTANCTYGSWADITDNKIIEITGLTYSTTGSSCLNTSRDTDSNGVKDNWSISTNPSDVDACDDTGATGYVAPTTGDLMLESRKISISLSGRLKNDTSVTKTITETFKIRNDYIFSAP